MDLKGKRILLLVPFFFDYHELIREELVRFGAEVDMFNNKLQPMDPRAKKSKIKFVRYAANLVYNLKHRYFYNAIYPTIKNRKYDIFICINGFLLTEKIIASIETLNPGLQKILYLWDTMTVFDWTKYLAFFDRVYSFDRRDADKYGLSYLPNFYPALSKPLAVTSHSLFFVGTHHHDRFNILESLFNRNVELQNGNYIKLLIRYKTSLHNRVIYQVLKPFRRSVRAIESYCLNYELVEKKIRRPFLIYSPISSQVATEQMHTSRCVLDIDLPYQSGYSHRVVLALALGKKLITTNKHILSEPFYSPAKIKIIDRENPEIDLSWLVHEISDDTEIDIGYLRLDNWLKKICNED